METLARAWARVISWRIITTIVGFVILYVMSGQIALSIGFATINAIIQTVFHIMHERWWDNKITWGKKYDRED
jgi:uncharacterized membrane protein